MRQDLRFAVRTLAKAPGFASIAVLALALGIGANTAIFSLVNAVLLRPLLFPDPDRLVMVWEEASFVGFPRNTPAPANFVDWKAQNQVFEDMAALRGRVYSLTASGDPEQLFGRGVTANFFSLLGVKPALGRVFRPEEDKPGAPHVVVISQGLWTRRFGADRGLIGQPILLDGQKFTVLGVMPAGFQFPRKDTDFWVPTAFEDRDWANRGSHYLNVVARIKPGVSIAQAQADMDTIARRLAREYPNNNTNLGAVVVPLRDQFVGQVRPALIVLLVAVAVVLLIACANIANLLMARATGRQKEIALRAALGAGRARLVRQLLTESVLLSSVGGLAGVLISTWSFAFLSKLIPLSIIGSVRLGLNLQVLAFNLFLSLLTGVVFGLAPALHVSRLDLNEALKQGGRSGGGIHGQRLRSALVVSEVALALVLLVGAGLLIQTFARLRGIDPGFRPDHVLTLRTILPRTKYAEFSKRVAFYEQVVDRVRSLPGVVSSGYTYALPLTEKGGTNGFSIEGRPYQRGAPVQDSNFRVVTPDYLRTMGIPLRRGRYLEDRDGPQSLPVAVINEAMARKFWPAEDALGKRFKIGSDGSWLTIVGIVGDTRQMGLELPGRQEMYIPLRQGEQAWSIPNELAIRTTVEPMSLAVAVRREIRAVDAEQPVSNVRPMEDIVETEVSQRRMHMLLLGAFAALALLLASLGIYGVLAYAVTQRTPEIGVRLALGARQADVIRMVVGQGMALALLGVGIGLVASFALSRLLASLLFGVSARDPLTFTAVPLLLLGVALAACYLPARRAAKVDPMVALRYE